MLREVSGLIESAAEAPADVKGHRDNAIGVLQDVDAARTHAKRQRARQRSPPFVLESVNDVAEGALVSTGGVNGVPAAVTGRTVERHVKRLFAGDAPRGEDKANEGVGEAP